MAYLVMLVSYLSSTRSEDDMKQRKLHAPKFFWQWQARVPRSRVGALSCDSHYRSARSRFHFGACGGARLELACGHERFHTYEENESYAEAGPGPLRTADGLRHFGSSVRLPRRVHRGRNAGCRADELCASGRQTFLAWIDGEPADENARERIAVLPERDAAGRDCFFTDSYGALGELSLGGRHGESRGD